MKETVEERFEGFEKKIQNKEFTSFTDLVIEFKSIKVDLEVNNFEIIFANFYKARV